MPNFTAYEDVLVREVNAHDGHGVTDVWVDEHVGVVTCSQNGLSVRVWDPHTLDLWLDIPQIN